MHEGGGAERGLAGQAAVEEQPGVALRRDIEAAGKLHEQIVRMLAID
jgi:hypothetical protein